MSGIDYARLAATALRLIERAGQAGQLRRPTSTGPKHTPVPGEPLLYPARFVITKFEASEIDGTRVLATDKKALVAAEGLAVYPALSDELVEANGRGYRIADVDTLMPATTPLVYVLQVRR